MIIGFSDVTQKGHLTSQICFVAGLFSQYSEKKHLIIGRNPVKYQYYLGFSVEEEEKKRNDLLRLAINGQLTNQLIKDYSIPLKKGLDYLDISFLQEKEEEYSKVLYEYLLEKAGEGYHYVFADLGADTALYRSVDKLVLCMPQSAVTMQTVFQEKGLTFEKGNAPFLLFGKYFVDSRWTKKYFSRGIVHTDRLGIPFSYDLFDAFQAGNLLDLLDRKYMNWEREYKVLSKFMNGGEERRK